MWNEDKLNRLRSAANDFDKTTATQLVDSYIEYVTARAEPRPPYQKEILAQLRRARWFNLMQAVGGALISEEVAMPVARRQYAQSLIELGALDDALVVLESLVGDKSCPDGERAEAQGLIGRVYKQLYVDRFAELGPARRATLEASVRAYWSVYTIDRIEHTWPGINSVAMLLRGARDGIAVSVGEDATRVAEAIRVVASSKQEHWDHATAAEACVALERWDEALEHLARYVKHPDLDAFSAASTLRQLKQVWQLKEDGPGGALLTVLQPAVMSAAQHRRDTAPERIGARLVLEVGELEAARSNAEARSQTLEKVFGKNGPRSLDWYQTGLQRARAVARIEKPSGAGYGTGFLVEAAAMFRSSEGSKELVLVTNAHVLGKTDPDALRPEDAVVRFETLENQRSFRVREVLFESSPKELDVTVVRLDAAVVGVEPYPLAPTSEPAFDIEGQRQLYVIGHPLGGRLSLSIDDNLQVGWARPKLHYRTPTAPGSSGSPVFDDSWRLIAVHHAGSSSMQRIDGLSGTYEANEGIWIHSVIEAIHKAGGAVGAPLEQTSSAVRPVFKSSVFISYAHADREWLEQLQVHLKPLTREIQVDFWDDRKLTAGSNWLSEIERQLDHASVAILLVSARFLASDFITTKEFPRLLEAATKRGLTIVPVAVADSLYRRVPELAALQFANDPAKPLHRLRKADRESALVAIAEKVAHILEVAAFSNPLRAIDAATYRVAGLGGNAEAAVGAHGFQSVATQVDSTLTMQSGTHSRVVFKWEDIDRLSAQDRQFIRTLDLSIQQSFDRWNHRWPERNANDPAVRSRVRGELAETRGQLCSDLRMLLSFFDRCGWQLDDHYYAVRYICEQSATY